MDLGTCVICYKEIPISPPQFPVIDKQLDVIFILKELLGLPSLSLAKWLEMFPEINPDSWINLCGECGEMVGEGRRMFEEILESTRKFRMIQEKVVEKLKSSQVSDCSKMQVGNVKEMVTKECRDFVNNHDYGFLRDPCTLGDVEAEMWLGNTMTVSGIQFSEQVDVKDESDDGVPSPRSLKDQDDPFEDYELDNAEDDETVKLENPEPPKKNDKPQKKKKPRYRLIDEEDAFLDDNGKVAFRCKVANCGAIYRCKRPYIHHKLRHSNEAPSFPCDQCQKTFLTEDLLRRHKYTHTGRRPKRVETKEVLEERKIRYQRKCPHCPMITNKYTLAHHIKQIHEKVFPFSCEFCGKGEINARELRYHQAEVHGICSVPDCKLTFPGNRQELKNHQIQVHGKEVDVKTCGDCGKLFIRMNGLRRHQIIAHQSTVNNDTGGDKTGGEGEDDDNQWVCEVCGTGFRLRALLTRHMWKHKKRIYKKRKPRKRELTTSMSNNDN